MKFTALTIVPLLIAFASCSQTNKLPASVSTVQSKQPESNESQSSLPESPQTVCGDALPSDTSIYPVAFYPVFVEYDEKHLELMKKYFCEDARKITREKTGKDAIQVGSFTSQERASKLKEKLMKYFSGVEVGEPTVVKNSNVLPEKNRSLEKDFIRMAGLTKEQFRQIIFLGEEKRVDRGNRDFQFRPVLPTYVPSGFHIELFEAVSKPGAIGRGGWLGYTLIYVNQNSQCFDITVDTSQTGGPPDRHEELEVTSKALGDVTLAYTGFDKGYQTSYISFLPLPVILRGNDTKYFFTSPNGDRSQFKKECTRIDLKEAIRIVENLEFVKTN